MASTDWQRKRSQRPRQRQRIKSQVALLLETDGRFTATRRLRDLERAIMADLGGADGLSAIKRALLRRFCACAVLAELLEAKMTNGERIDISEHAVLSST